ncbi:uncharacterized protein LOC135934838 [Cloeon dipterum]|uniref:uncharacterized protein LOC135934838 n=1 Tax=Cloeon dipterum TaxID=197152 RepID=UPI00321FD832
MTRLIILLALSSFTLASVNGARILGLFPYPSRSHLNVYSTLTKALAARGHELVVVSAYSLAKPPANYTDIDSMPAVKAIHDAIFNADVYDDFSDFPLYLIMTSFWDEGLWVTEEFLKYSKVQDILQDKRGFDLVISEAFVDEAVYAFAFHFQAPLILISSMNGLHWINHAVGNPAPLSYYPNPMLTYTDRMEFSERLTNFLFTKVWDLGNYFYYYPKQNELKEKFFGPGLPDVREIERNASLVLLNAHFTTTFPRPLVPAMVEVGGMHVSPKTNKLPADIQEFLDGATQGAIYFSMGSNLRSDLMPAEKIREILAAFAKIPQRVLWKWESDELAERLENVKTAKWLPQQDILAHPNVKVFITHGGLLSAQEAAFHGVALIGIPIFGDQMLNVKQAERAGYAVVVNYHTISESSFSAAIAKALHDDRIQSEAKRRAKVVRDQPQTALERAVYWTEYVLRHRGAPHLRSEALSLDWYQLELLDVYSFITLVLLALLLSLAFCVRKLISNCTRNNKIKSDSLARGKNDEMQLSAALALAFLLAGCQQTLGAKILAITPIVSPSHGIWNRALLEGLADKGHDVTAIIPFVGKNRTGISYHDIGGLYEDDDFIEFAHLGIKGNIDAFWDFATEVNPTQAKSEVSKRLLIDSKEKYDLVIYEMCMSEVFVAILPKFQAPIVAIDAYADGWWNWEAFGVDARPSIFPSSILPYKYPMTFRQRVVNFLTRLYDRYQRRNYLKVQQALANHVFGKQASQIDEVENNYDFFLINNGPPGVDLGRALPPNFKEVGCLQCRPADPSQLQPNVREFLDSATDGFIFFSLGSNVKSSLLPDDVKKGIIEVFGKLKQKVLWKFEDDNLPGKPKNVLINKWLSQQDVLGHKNMRIFITHGGRLSAQEANYHGVPLVVIPIFADQHKNGENALNAGVGVTLKFLSFTKEKFAKAIHEVLNNPIYRENAQRYSSIARDTLHTPLEEATFWIEYVIRHKGAKHLRPAGQHLNWIQLHSIDVIAFLLSPFVLIAFLLKKFLCSKKEKVKKQ